MEQEKQPIYGDKLGLMYKAWTMDCISDLGYAVSLDFIHRPELYQKVNNIADKITELQAMIDNTPYLPGKQTRTMLFKSIFGASDGLGNGNDGSTYQTGRMALIAAAADFSENAQPTGYPMLRERVLSALVPQKDHFIGIEGTSLYQTNQRIRKIFKTSVEIIIDENVRVVFGINQEIDPEWPENSNDSQGAKLIEKITQQLKAATPSGPITRDRFIRLQRIAEKGSLSIKGILDPDVEKKDKSGTEKLDALIAELYAWGSDLGLIGGAVLQPVPRRSVVNAD